MKERKINNWYKQGEGKEIEGKLRKIKKKTGYWLWKHKINVKRGEIEWKKEEKEDEWKNEGKRKK